MEKLNGEGLDLKQVGIKRLKEIFPECIVDGKVDFNILKNLLGDSIENNSEAYSFCWIGKNESLRYSLTPSTGTLIPCKEKSVNWNKTNNIYVEGDNLEVLKALSKTYHNSVKMIYIDPPYNTGKDFVYKDNFHDNLNNYIEISNQKLKTNPESSGRYHTDWLNMMLPRLKIAREMLSDDGLIFISIDENELFNLEKLCESVFGESNFVSCMVWKSKSGGANDANLIAADTEYVLVYARNIDSAKIFNDKNAEVTTSYNQVDENGRRYSLDRLDKQSLGYHESLDFPIVGPDGRTYTVEHKNPNNKVARWRWGKDTVQERYDELVFKWPYVYTKNYQKDDGATPRNLMADERFGRTRTGKTEVADLFNGVTYFDFPKPTKLISFLISIASKDENDIIMDFFSGSGTTGHAVMKCFADDNIKRRFVLVQLPEKTDEKSKAFEDGYLTIPDIAEERLRRAGKKIYEELKEKKESAGLLADDAIDPDSLDFGFKVFRLDSSNIKPWDGSIKYDANDLTQLNSIIKEDRTMLDVAYEVMLKYGVFDKQLEEKTLNGKQIFSVDNDSMVISLNDSITMEDITEIIKLRPSVVVFKESGFEDDNAKINAEYTIKHYLDPKDEQLVKVLCI